MKNIKSILFVILAGVFVLQSCQQENYDVQNEQTEVQAEVRIWPLIIAAAVTIIVKLSEGQWQGTTDGGGNKGCKGIGNCGNHTIVKSTGEGTGSGDDSGYLGDYVTDAFLAVDANTGNVVFAMDENADPEVKAKFFYDSQVYMSPTKIIDNPQVLDELGLTEPVVMEEGFYEVQEDGEILYIVIQ